MIRPDVMQSFVDAFADAGFEASAFLPSYGLAEATLAVSIMPPGEGIRVELVEETQLSGVEAGQDRPQRFRAIVRSEEHTSELQSLMRISYAVFCLNKKTRQKVENCNTSI